MTTPATANVPFETLSRNSLLRRRAGLLQARSRSATALHDEVRRVRVRRRRDAARCRCCTTSPASPAPRRTSSIKAGAQRVAAELGLMLVAPDTSPRGLRHRRRQRRLGLRRRRGLLSRRDAGAVVATHYRMYCYVTQELPALVDGALRRSTPTRAGIFGHSMGGHGALTIALQESRRYRSVSAFAPIVVADRSARGARRRSPAISAPIARAGATTTRRR